MTNTTLCSGCVWSDKDKCTSPELSNSVWAYMPTEGSYDELASIWQVCRRDRLQNHTATAYLCPMIAAHTGSCQHYEPQKAQKQP